jgi:hypothetical protein
MKILQPMIPKEHGAWAVLIVPMAVAATIVESYSYDLMLLTLSALAVFMSHVPLQSMLRNRLGEPQGGEKIRRARFWATASLVAGAAFAVPLLAKGLWLLAVFGGLGAVGIFGNLFLTLRAKKTVVSDLVAVSGLTLTAPAAYYVATGSFNQTALLLWVLNFLFFGCSVVYVHMKIRAAALQKVDLRFAEKLSVGKLNVAYHAAVLSIVGVLALGHYTPEFAFLAFVPMAIHAAFGTLRLTGHVRFKNLGLLLLGQSLLFGLLMGILR